MAAVEDPCAGAQLRRDVKDGLAGRDEPLRELGADGAGDAKTAWVDSPPSRSRHSYRPLTRPDRPYRNESTEVWAVPFDIPLSPPDLSDEPGACY